MKTKFHRLFSTLALLVLSTLNLQLSTCLAQGTAFTYQGRLNSGGSPATGNYDFRFRLDADPLGNTILATAFANALPVTNGLFITTIDFGTGWFNGSNYWLEVDVRTNGAASYVGLTPLQPLLPTPYAIMANSASNLLGTLPAAQLSAGTAAINITGNAATATTAGSATTATTAASANSVAAANITGTILNASLPASTTFSGTVTASSFSGNGANVTGVNAASLNGLGAANFWQTGGNSGTTPGANFIGTTDSQPLELFVNGKCAFRLEPAINFPFQSANVIGGYSSNSVASGVVGATIAGGGYLYNDGAGDTFSYPNQVLANFGTVGGGFNNTASDEATVAGGANNTASGIEATVAGGNVNTAGGTLAAVGGGAHNTASGYSATVGGGIQNLASGAGAFVGGGGHDGNNSVGNTASGNASVVTGGLGNQATTNYATIPGGANNIAGGQYSFAAGQQAQALNQGSFVWADSQNGVFASTANDQFLIRAKGGVGIGTTTPVAGLDVENSPTGVNHGNWGYLQQPGYTAGPLSGSPNLAIYTSGTIGASTYYAFSDARIKNMIGVSAGAKDLKTLRAIEVTDYTYKDKVANGDRQVKKVIAQQVESVYPQAVSKTTGVVPDIYQPASQHDGWVTLATNLKVGERVKLVSEIGQGIYPVLETRDGAFRTDFKPATEKVFVYGREVNDFRNVDYEALTMLNVSATQELARKLDAQQAALSKLQEKLGQTLAEKETLLKHLVALEARDQAREDRLARIESSLDKNSAQATYASLHQP